MQGNRRLEMRVVRDLVTKKNVHGIAEQIRKMKRIWLGTPIEKGMTRRREAEADLIEETV